MSYQTPIELFNIIDTIVDYIRVTGSITASSEVSGTYTLTTVNTLANNDYITIDSISYKVSNVTGTSFTIKDATGLDFTNQTWKANAPYFMHEKEAKAGAVLNEKTKQDNYKWQKYPLILLIHPYTQVQDSRDYSYSSTFQLILITNTEQSDWSDDRYDNNITPILRPIQESLINALATSVYTRVNNAYDIDYEWTDLLYIDGNPFPDKMDGVMLDVNSLEILEVQACVTTEPTTYNLILSSGEGGSTVPTEGTYTFNNGENTAVYANVDTGYRFVKWVVNTIDIVKNPLSLVMNQIKNVVAEFIAQWTLTTSVSGNGTISPLGANVYDDGTTVDLTVTADPDNEIDRVEEDGTPITSPYQVVMDASKTVIAYFNALITAIQDVFGTTPITESGLNYWPDASGNNNKVQIKNTQVGYFAGDGWVKYVETSPQNHEIELTFTYTGVFSGAYPTLFAFGSFSYGIFLEYAIDGNVTFKPGAAGQITLFPLSDITINTKSTIKVVKSGNDFEIFLNGDSKATWSSTFVMSNNLIINGDEYSSPNPVTHWEGQIHHIKLTNTDTSDVVIEDYFQRSGGVETDNTGSGGNGTFQGGTVSEFWSVTSDVAYPALAAYGGEVYEKDTNPGDNNYYIYVIKAASGFITPTISGYTKIEEHEPNRVWDIKNVTYDGIQITGIETDATFDDIIVLEDSATIDITKTTTEISNLIISE